MRFNNGVNHKLMYLAVPMHHSITNVEKARYPTLFPEDWYRAMRGASEYRIPGHIYYDHQRAALRHAIVAYPAQWFYGDDPRPDLTHGHMAVDAVLLIAVDTRMTKDAFLFWAAAVLGEPIIDPDSYRPTTIDLSQWRGVDKHLK